MADIRILAFSSSRTGNKGYLETALPLIDRFLGPASLQIAFIPFASVDNDYDEYAATVSNALSGLPHRIVVANPAIADEVIKQSDVIMVGGGNTFKLLHDLAKLSLLPLIRDKVGNGTPYIGWSAGSNILCPTIGTTNDMPIVQPPGFQALALLPFQINPHYFNYKVPGQNGESRDQRLMEFVKLHPDLPVLGLPEGSAVLREANTITFFGDEPAVLFSTGGTASPGVRRTIMNNTNLSWLM